MLAEGLLSVEFLDEPLFVGVKQSQTHVTVCGVCPVTQFSPNCGYSAKQGRYLCLLPLGHGVHAPQAFHWLMSNTGATWLVDFIGLVVRIKQLGCPQVMLYVKLPMLSVMMRLFKSYSEPTPAPSWPIIISPAQKQKSISKLKNSIFWGLSNYKHIMAMMIYVVSFVLCSPVMS